MDKITYLHIGMLLTVILTETFLSIRHEIHENKVKDTAANLCIGITIFITGIGFKGFSFFLLAKVQALSFFDFGSSIGVWVILFLLSDFCHYGIHYLEHKSRFFWAIHSVHHSSENFNFSTAIRAAHSNAAYNFFYKLPLCLIGFDVLPVALVESILLTYAFFLHTESVKKLGWFEYFFNTPSHHRVHHASDEKYLDKNFGCMLIIWDKLFGTFQAEEEKPVYGLTRPLKTYNPIKIVFHEWIAICKDVFKAKSWKERLSYLFKKPGWAPVANNELPVAVVRVAKRKPDCKKCSKCSETCLARLEDIKNKMNSVVQSIPQPGKVLIPIPVVSLPHTV